MRTRRSTIGRGPSAGYGLVFVCTLRTAAAPEQAQELLTLAKGNGLVLRGLHNYATIASRYHQERPK